MNYDYQNPYHMDRNPNDMTQNPYYRNMNPDPMNPGYMNPDPMNPSHMNPGHMNPSHMNPGHMNPGYMNPSMNPGQVNPGHMMPNPNSHPAHLKDRVLSAVAPVLQYGMKEAMYTSHHHAMTEVAAITYLMGMGYDPRMARQIVESWEIDEAFYPRQENR
ncbi:hypothetical protein ABNN70_01345 [Sporolactobacillus sp. Y61]|uniref:Uncharacterized protein n=1 Tax=Sporolactobacillus sp. Y61 TaxID=3160863 RepID=A0AAU8IG54_9BACL